MSNLYEAKGIVYWMQWATESLYAYGLPDVRHYEDFLILQIKVHVPGSLMDVNRYLLAALLKTVEDLQKRGVGSSNALVWQVVEAETRSGELPYIEELRGEYGVKWPSEEEFVQLRANRSWKTEPWRF